jgi:hypothetical protein
MLPAEAGDSCDGRTAADNQTVRNVFVIGPDKKIKLVLSYPMTTGRNFDEVLRVIDSLQLTAKHKVATPVNWKQGEDVIIVTAVSDAEAKEKYPRAGGAEAVPALRRRQRREHLYLLTLALSAPPQLARHEPPPRGPRPRVSTSARHLSTRTAHTTSARE